MSAISTSVDAATFPSSEEIFGWIEYLSGLGHRKTGTPEGRASADYIAAELEKLGLEPTIERAPTPCPSVTKQRFTVFGRELPTFWANGTGRNAETGEFVSSVDGAEVVYLGHGWEVDFNGQDVAGKIVICDIEFKPWTNADILDRNPRGEAYDPDGSLNVEYNKYDIYSPHNWPFNYFRAQEAGAVGFIGILQNYMDEINYNEDYTENGHAIGVEWMSIPALWTSRAAGAKLVEELSLEDQDPEGSLHLTVDYELKDALNIHATLEGQSSEIILVHSHHDAVFAGAVQDASGVSEVLAQASYFTQLPLSERPKSIMFAFTDTHFTDYIGHEAFIEARNRAEERIILDVCIEHIAKEIELGPDNEAIETGQVEPRLVYITEESGLYEDVKDAFARHGLGRTFFLPVHQRDTAARGPYVFQSDEVISDAYAFADAGIPVVSLVCGPMYLFHPSDTTARIAVDQLRPVGLAFAEIITTALKR